MSSLRMYLFNISTP